MTNAHSVLKANITLTMDNQVILVVIVPMENGLQQVAHLHALMTVDQDIIVHQARNQLVLQENGQVHYQYGQ